jgi:Sugar (and other) transporter
VWPVAVASIGAYTYFIFTAFNVFSLTLVYWKFPETKGLSLEQIDSRFSKINVHSKNEAIPESMLKSDEVQYVEEVVFDKKF